jgi:phosphatidylinositol glycan class N
MVVKSDLDASLLDTWVFDHFQDMITQAKSNTTLHEMLNSDQIVFFLQ